MTTSENVKTEGKHENMFGRAEKSKTIRRKDTTRGNKSEGSGERKKTKKIPR